MLTADQVSGIRVFFAFLPFSKLRAFLFFPSLQPIGRSWDFPFIILDMIGIEPMTLGPRSNYNCLRVILERFFFNQSKRVKLYFIVTERRGYETMLSFHLYRLLCITKVKVLGFHRTTFVGHHRLPSQILTTGGAGSQHTCAAALDKPSTNRLQLHYI